MSFRNQFFQAILFTAAACLTGNANSAVFERDFVHGSGDGLLTYDDVNQREWLDVTAFANRWSSEEAFSNAQLDPDFDFASEFPELAPGGVYEDFTLATRDDATALAVSAGIDVTTLDFAVNDAPVDQLIELLGATYVNPIAELRRSIGFLDEMHSRISQPDDRRYTAVFRRNVSSSAGVDLTGWGSGILLETTGVMLSRTVVPEPVACFSALMLVAAQLVAGYRGRRQE